MGDQSSSAASSSGTMRFLSFANDKEDAEKAAKLREAAQRIEQAIERQKSVNELVDYKPPPEEGIDLANDTRPLYERLLEQKNKKQEALEESQKLSNLVTKLDEDEAYYLNELAKNKQEEEIRKRLEVYDVLEEKKRNSERKIIEEEKKLKQSFLGSPRAQPTKISLKSKLSSIIKVKPKTVTTDTITKMVTQDQKPTKEQAQDIDTSPNQDAVKRRSIEMSDATHHNNSSEITKLLSEPNKHSDSKRLKTNNLHDDIDDGIPPRVAQPKCNCAHRDDLMRCIGVLPSLPLVEVFPDSSDSDDSSDNIEQRLVPRIGGSNK